nr:glutamate receptor 2.3 [Quercus suber]
MSLEDFYASNSHYRTRVVLNSRDSKSDVVGAAAAGAGQGGAWLEDKGKEVKPLPKVKGPKATLKLKDSAPKAKDAVPKVKEDDLQSKEADPKATNPLVSQPGSKDDPHLAKA